MINYYEVLGVTSSATEGELRRAYRILARRYHPDLNPNNIESADKFKLISEAYRILQDEIARQKYDSDLERSLRRAAHDKLRAYRRQQEQKIQRDATADYVKKQKEDVNILKGFQKRQSERNERSKSSEILKESLGPLRDRLSGFVKKAKDWSHAKETPNSSPKKSNTAKPSPRTTSSSSTARPHKSVADIRHVSILEISVSVFDAITGVRKAVELDEKRKINVRIPAGVRNGSVVRMRASQMPDEEIVLIVRVAKHPMLSMEPRGLIVEIPISIREAICGASITIPTLEDPVMLKIPPNTQGSSEFRVRGKGIPVDGQPGDLFVRITIRVPESDSAVGIQDKAKELEQYYENPVRSGLPKSLLEL